jgi:hypothetical protein
MTPKEKAEQIYNEIKNKTECKCYDFNLDKAKESTLITHRHIILALEEYGKTTFELQNMETEFRWWQQVKKEIELL